MRRDAVLALLVALMAVACPAQGADENFSRLATAKLAAPVESKRLVVAEDSPQLWLAQRVIDRHWGASDESTYVEVEVPGYKSEGWALALSAAVPGTGQLYVGEGSGWWFLLGEVVGWSGLQLSNRKADRYAGDAAQFVGDPYDTASVWSFARYQYYSGAEVSGLQTLWAVDRDAYYASIERDPKYLVGYAGLQPELTFLGYRGLRGKRDETLLRSRYMETALLLNHVFAAWDAMRAARIHNFTPKRKPGTRLQLGERWGDSGPELRAALVRNF